jgi:sulfur-oxidizing protein SoxB
MDVDMHLARNVEGIDFILGGHTHDAVPEGIPIIKGNHKTVVFNSGTNGKFLSLLDIDIRKSKIKGFRYKLLPVFSNLLPPNKHMAQYIQSVRAPYEKKLQQKLAVTESLLFRRGTFSGSFDQLIVDALRETQDTEIALSPGFRWGTTLMPGDPIRFEDVMAHTAITYPIVTRTQISGEQLHANLEDVADNRFNTNPYLQQGGDMVRSAGLSYSIDAMAKIGKRINDLKVNGKSIRAKKKYWVAGWGSMQKLDSGKPAWEALSDYLQHKRSVKVDKLNRPRLRMKKKNLGSA